MSAIDSEGRLVDALSLLTGTLVADYDVIDIMQTLAEACSSVLDVDAAGVLLADPESDLLDLVASTDDSTRVVEAMQLSALAGPCIEAYRTSSIVSIADLTEDSAPFGPFREVALAQGFRSVYAIPMRLRAKTIGALNLFRANVGELGSADRRLAQTLTDVATVGVLQERSIRASQLVQQQLQRALDSRVVIEQAKGILAHTHDLTMDAAFNRIRTFARHERLSIAVVSQRLVDRTLVI